MDNQNNLSIPKRPSLLEKMQAKVCVVAAGNKDAPKVETVKQDKAAEVMPVQVVKEDKHTISDADSNSNWISILNKFKYYGISLCDRVTDGNNAINLDAGYIEGNNDNSQFYTGKETIRSTGVPFAPSRYMRHNNRGYINGHNTRYKIKDQNFYVLKLGVAWTGDFVAPNSVCTWRPGVENIDKGWIF